MSTSDSLLDVYREEEVTAIKRYLTSLVDEPPKT
jgi:hypothetical protein